jgi:hypothetical protein
MPLDEEFLQAVASLHVPRMGTERVAPLLYHILHFARPQRVLEVGMGYTTPFIALALKELATLARSEAASFDAKTEPYVTGARRWTVPGCPRRYRWRHRPSISSLISRCSLPSTTSAPQRRPRGRYGTC